MTLSRKTPLRSDPSKTRAWQDRSRRPLSRGPTLDQVAPLRQTNRKKAPAIPQAMRHRVYARSGHRCVCGCGRACVQLHHVLPRRMFPELALIEANLVGIADLCHGRHESAFRRLPRECLPRCALDLARDVGPRAEAYIERTYPPTRAEPGGTRQTG